MLRVSILVIVWIITCSIYPTSNDGVCLCDVRPLVCDKYCQCDAICFNEKNNSGPYATKWCVQNALYFSSNAPYNKSQESETTCFSDVNYGKENYFQPIRDTRQFQWNSVSVISLNLINKCKNNGLCLIYNNKMLGPFTLPSDPGCLGVYLPTFLSNVTTKCTRVLNFNDSGLSCTQLPSVSMYTDGLKFLRLPISKFIRNNNYTTEMVIFDDNTTSISLVTCRNVNNDVIPCPTLLSTLDPTNQACIYGIASVIFSFIYNESGLINISVEFQIISNITTSLFSQLHTVQFIYGNSLPNTTSTMKSPIITDYLSGNPGYLRNYPIRAGYIENTTTVPYIKMISYPRNPPIYPNEYDRINFGWWPILNNDDCTKFTDQTRTILFGQNTFSSCILRLKPLSQYNPIDCNKLEQHVKLLLNYNQTPITHVGVWGSADNKRLNDWIKVDVFNEMQNNITLTNGSKSWSCQNITTGQTIDIYYARKGSLYDPQNRVISVHKIYKRGTIGYTCYGYYACADNQLNSEQIFFITTNVLFHDLTLL
ncbi:Tectonic-1 [Schistosoma japonicum]|nr:Tectonic-1 [Schistosoma japonicum]